MPSGTNYKYPLGSRQAIWLCSKARGGKIVDYLTDEQRSYGDKEPPGTWGRFTIWTTSLIVQTSFSEVFSKTPYLCK